MQWPQGLQQTNSTAAAHSGQDHVRKQQSAAAGASLQHRRQQEDADYQTSISTPACEANGNKILAGTWLIGTCVSPNAGKVLQSQLELPMLDVHVA